ncbi:MAG TPA: hypothetical protein VK466_01110, partial [Terriglobales bacterium]|nr:hypothetical protein [Terriglobales bacterium]
MFTGAHAARNVLKRDAPENQERDEFNDAMNELSSTIADATVDLTNSEMKIKYDPQNWDESKE